MNFRFGNKQGSEGWRGKIAELEKRIENQRASLEDAERDMSGVIVARELTDDDPALEPHRRKVTRLRKHIEESDIALSHCQEQLAASEESERAKSVAEQWSECREIAKRRDQAVDKLDKRITEIARLYAEVIELGNDLHTAAPDGPGAIALSDRDLKHLILMRLDRIVLEVCGINPQAARIGDSSLWSIG